MLQMDEQHEHSEDHVHPDETAREYFKFVLVIIAITLVAVVITMTRGWNLGQFMADFMAVFFLVFGLFKLVNLEMFAITYRSYDIIAKYSMAWAYAFPFIEIALGLAYLFTGGPSWLNLTTMLITGVASIGVLKELTIKSKIMCACLGTVIRLPLSKISFVEDFLMFIMAAFMLAL